MEYYLDTMVKNRGLRAILEGLAKVVNNGHVLWDKDLGELTEEQQKNFANNMINGCYQTWIINTDVQDSG